MPDISNVIPEPIVRDRGDGSLAVDFDWSAAGVDRPNTGGIVVEADAKGIALASRLVAATRAGRVFSEARIATDVNGQTYVQARCAVFGRHLNADLRRLGF